MKTFAGGIVADPWRYMVDPSAAAHLLQQVEAFEAAYQVAIAPATRTSTAIGVKDRRRAEAEQLCRLMAQQIKLNAGISDPDKMAIGVPPVNRSRTTIHVAAASPAMKVIAATPGAHHLRYTEVLAGHEGVAKPFGALQLQVFVAIGDAPARDVNDARYCGAFTRSKFQIRHTHADDGKVATYWSRWAGRRGDVGPWSTPVSMRIAA